MNNTNMARGFALPTVLIASVVMLVILVTSLPLVTAVNQTLNEQQYNRIAREASYSAIAMVQACLNTGNNAVTWTSPLTPATDCTGTVQPGASIYINNGSRIRSTFSVNSIVTDGGFHRVNAVGTTEILRQSTNTVSRSFTSSLWASINYYATKSASGFNQTCGLVGGVTWCWGQGTYGKLGNGSTNDSLTPVQVLREPGVLQGKLDTDVALGGQFGCVVADGGVYCWGRNNYGQIGKPAGPSSNPSPQRVGGALLSKTVTSVTAGGRHACAITSTSEIYCWGRNDRGQLGNGDPANANSYQPVQVATDTGLAGKTVTQINAGLDIDSTCAVASGVAYCWGSNDSGELGIDSTTTQFNKPQQLGVTGLLAGKTVTNIAIASNDLNALSHGCAVADGSAYCWGDNTNGRLGNNTTTASTSPVAVDTSGVMNGKTLTGLGVGVQHACVLSTDQNIYCWGANDFGQLGDNAASGARSLVPVAVVKQAGRLLGATITRLDAGGNRGCVIANQSNYCWGLNNNGQIGDGTTISRPVPTPSRFLNDLKAPYYF
ncbi:MAG: hypothetical protein WAR37_05155 [Candidatus Microsaccharimonas sp.]